jgi:hypothetical protein
MNSIRFSRREFYQWVLAIVLVIAGVVMWRLASNVPPAEAGGCTNPCGCGGPGD